MALKEKLCELEQQEAKLYDEARELFNRCETENRLPTADENQRLIMIRGDETRGSSNDGGEIMKVRQNLQNLRRVLAVERFGDDPQSGKDPWGADGAFERESRKSSPLAHEDPVNTKDAKHRYSFAKAIWEAYANKGGLTGLEREVSDQLTERTGMPPGAGGFKMPHHDQTLRFKDVEKRKRVQEMRSRGQILSFEEIRAQREMRALDSGAGAGSVPTILDRDWIEILRNAIKVKLAGARDIMDLKGKFAIPRQNAASTSYWVAESGSPTGSNPTLDQVLFTPHTIGAFVDISRRFFELTILESGEEFVKEDLTAILARGIDLAALNGTGTAQQPMGILQNPGITSARTVSLGTNGGVPTWAALVELYTIVARGNAADLGKFSYIGNADVEGTLATTAKIGSTFPVYLLDVDRDPPTIYAKAFYATQQLVNNLTKGSSGATLSPLIGGIWNQLIMAYWSGTDILVDPYTGSSSGTIRVVALQDMDIQARHNEAFSVIVDMITNQSQ